MTISDDVLDRALDAAEAQMALEPDSNEESNTHSPDVQGESPEEVAHITRKVLDKSPNRDSNGKFTKPQADKSLKSPQGETGTPDISDQDAELDQPEVLEEAQADSVPIEVPNFWSADDKAHFAKAPREVQQAPCLIHHLISSCSFA